jgi:hypothetical protein
VLVAGGQIDRETHISHRIGHEGEATRVAAHCDDAADRTRAPRHHVDGRPRTRLYGDDGEQILDLIEPLWRGLTLDPPTAQIFEGVDDTESTIVEYTGRRPGCARMAPVESPAMAASPRLPEQPFRRVRETFAGFDRTWYLCGGWAVDAWLGRETRKHGDVDVAVFEPDQRALFDHLAGWHLIAHDEVLGGGTTERWDGHDLALPAHIHARAPGAANPDAVELLVTDARSEHDDDLNFEFIVNRRAGESWVLEPPWLGSGLSSDRDPCIVVPLTRAIRTLPNGVAAAAPEILQFFKATAYRDSPEYPRPHDEADFQALLPLLDRDAVGWLREAISTVDHDHPWLDRLP